MKNLLLTGCYGFIGAGFLNYIFDKCNCFIVNIDAMLYCANKENVRKEIRESNRYKFVRGNVGNYDLVTLILEDYNIDTIIHFGAMSHVDLSYKESIDYTKYNVLATHSLLEAVKNYGKIKKFIHVSTDEIYGSTEGNEAKKENSLLYPSNPYASSKGACELYIHSYIQSFKLPIIITRSNNIYGKFQYPEKLIPKFINLLQDNKKVTIHGDGSAIRGFLYLDDVCEAFYTILEKGQIGEIYNISSAHEYTVMEIAKILIKKLKNTEDYNKWIEYVDDRPFNDKRYFINDDKLKDLGWKPKWSFEDGLEETLKYYVKNYKSSNGKIENGHTK